MDPNNLILTTAGRDYIVSKMNNNEQAVLSSFRLGDNNAFTPNIGMTDIFGDLTYTGDDSEMFYVWTAPHEVIIRCCVESDKGDFFIGNAGIFSDTGILVFITRFSYIHWKMASTDTQVGGRWTYQVRLKQNDMNLHWDFSNLNFKPAVFNGHDLASAPQYPFDSYWTEIQLEDCLLPTNRSAYPLLSGNVNRNWFGTQFQGKYSDIEVQGDYIFDGGETLDYHTYLG